MRPVPHGVVAVLGGVLAEGREHDAVWEGQTAELEGFEEFGYALLAFFDQSRAGGRFLGWSEEGDAWRGSVDIVEFSLGFMVDVVVGSHIDGDSALLFQLTDVTSLER